MRNNITVSLVAFSLSVLVSACYKFDMWSPAYNNPQKEFDLCRITQVVQTENGPIGPVRTGNFYYSNRTNLDSVVFDVQGIVHYWKYDASNNLAEYRESYDHDVQDFITLHKYASANGSVVRDTTWLPGASGYIIQVWTLEYDKKGRVIRETGIRIDDDASGTPLPERTYHYDQNGNLQTGDFVREYDKAVNYLRTNKVLQFIHRNYSMNNPTYYVRGYNSYGLPLAHELYVRDQFLGWGHPKKMSYSCIPIPVTPGHGDGCRLATMKQLLPGNLYRYGTFYYTPDGRPMSVIFEDPVNLSTGSHQFEYDNQRRLIRYFVAFGIARDIYHTYGYKGGRISVDTLHSELGPPFTQISQLTYDNKGRIVKEDIEVTQRDDMPVSEHTTIKYEYDANGNLVSPLVTEYDNNVNYLRTNPIWMFLHRNYSRNNHQGVIGYNSQRLPLGFTTSLFGFLRFGEPEELSYTCMESNSNQ